LTVQRWSTSSD